MTILPYNKQQQPGLENLMVAYMAELGDDTPEEIIRGRLFDYLHTQLDDRILQVLLAWEEDVPVGFSVFQIDRPESDWCLRPGWGFVREFYITPEYRKAGAGRRLARQTEQVLRELGAEQLYLTSTNASPFWQRCGWVLSEKACGNGQSILEK